MAAREKKQKPNDPWVGGLWDVREVRIKFRDKLMGSMPLNQDVLEAWARRVAGMSEEQVADLKDEIVPDAGDAEVAPPPPQICGFKRDEIGCYIEPRRTFKAGIKEAATLLRYTNPNDGGGPGRQFFQHGVFVEPERFHLPGEPSGPEIQYGTVQVKDPSGRMTTQSIVQQTLYFEKVEVEFRVRSLKGKLTDAQFSNLLEHLSENGLGAKRSSGFGQFDVVSWRTL